MTVNNSLVTIAVVRNFTAQKLTNVGLQVLLSSFLKMSFKKERLSISTYFYLLKWTRSFWRFRLKFFDQFAILLIFFYKLGFFLQKWHVNCGNNFTFFLHSIFIVSHRKRIDPIRMTFTHKLLSLVIVSCLSKPFILPMQSSIKLHLCYTYSIFFLSSFSKAGGSVEKCTWFYIMCICWFLFFF